MWTKTDFATLNAFYHRRNSSPKRPIEIAKQQTNHVTPELHYAFKGKLTEHYH